MSLPYGEDASAVSVTIDISLHSDGKEFAERLKNDFESFSKGEKELKIVFEKGNNVSIYSEEELKRMKELEKRRQDIAESQPVKAALEMGFEIKGISAE